MIMTKHDAGDRQEGEAFAPGDGGKGERWQTTGHRADDIDAVCREVERGARGDAAKDGHQWERDVRDEAIAEQDGGGDKRGERDGWQAGVGQARSELPGLDDGVARVGGEAEHVAQHGDADLQADAGEEADQDRA